MIAIDNIPLSPAAWCHYGRPLGVLPSGHRAGGRPGRATGAGGRLCGRPGQPSLPTAGLQSLRPRQQRPLNSGVAGRECAELV